jgi:hypothetical protein
MFLGAREGGPESGRPALPPSSLGIVGGLESPRRASRESEQAMQSWEYANT